MYPAPYAAVLTECTRRRGRPDDARHGAEVVAVIDPEGRPLGAVTVAAFRDRVVTGEVSLKAPCRAIMHSGFPMLGPGFDTGAALLAMTRGRTCFAGITENGAGDSPLQGIVTDRDLELYRGINPPFLLREILDARGYGSGARPQANRGHARRRHDGSCGRRLVLRMSRRAVRGDSGEGYRSQPTRIGRLAWLLDG